MRRLPVAHLTSTCMPNVKGHGSAVVHSKFFRGSFVLMKKLTLKLRKLWTLKISLECSLCFDQSHARPCNRRKQMGFSVTELSWFLVSKDLHRNLKELRIKLPKKYLQHCHILRTDKKNLSLLLLPSWPHERKLDLKLSIFQLKRRFMSVQKKWRPFLAYFYEIWN